MASVLSYPSPPPKGKVWVKQSDTHTIFTNNTYYNEDVPGTVKWTLQDVSKSPNAPPNSPPAGKIWVKKSDEVRVIGNNTYYNEDVPGSIRWELQDIAKSSDIPPGIAPAGKVWVKKSDKQKIISSNTYYNKDIPGTIQWDLQDTTKLTPGEPTYADAPNKPSVTTYVNTSNVPAIIPPLQEIKTIDQLTLNKTYGQIAMIFENDFTHVKLYKAVRLTNNSPVIIKEYPTTYDKSKIFNEINILKAIQVNCSSFNFICLVDVFNKDGKYNVATTFFTDYITLKEYIIKTPHDVRSSNALVIISNIINSVTKLHSLSIAHRDLNNTNIMINPIDLNIKIIDFGNACKDPCTLVPGDKMFLPPETIDGVYVGFDKGKSIDTWSIGMLLFDILTGYTVAELYCKQKHTNKCDDVTTKNEFNTLIVTDSKLFAKVTNDYVNNVELYIDPTDKNELEKQNWKNFTGITTYKDLLKLLLNPQPDRKLPKMITQIGGKRNYYKKYLKYKQKNQNRVN